VESVAFVSNRSGLLALVFALASCLAGGRWAARGGRGAWAASLAFTAAAVLSKQSAVSLPLLLAVVVLHHRPDARWREWLRPLLPHALLAAGAAVVHAAVARSAGILLAPVDSPLDALARVPRALFAAQFYVWKLVWPVELTIEYDVEGILRPSAGLLASSAAAVAAAAWLLAPARRRSLAGRLLLFYLAALLPVSNLLPTVPTVADRYAQLPLVALVPLVALPALARLPLRAAMAAVGAATVLLVGLTVRQLPVWRDDAALLAHATAVNPGAPAALGNLVFVLWEQGRHAEAMRVAHELERVRPGDFRFAYVQALAAERDGRLADAEHWLEAASRVPDARAYAVHAKLGDVYLRRGRRDDARRAYERALALAADDPLAAPYREVIQRNLRLLGGGG
jgi:4-amino-4-deoxy-L-arabinose transferase-like glycosyltransferase